MLVKTSGEAIAGSEVRKTVAEYLFARVNGFTYEQEQISHAIDPRIEPAASVNYNVLQRLKLMLHPFFSAESNLVENVIFELVISPHCFYNFITVVNSGS